MRARPGPLGLVLVAVAASGCLEPVELWPGGMDADLLCLSAGASCAGAAECCSQVCTARVCARDVCRTVLETCSTALDCCSGVCTGGVCEAQSGCAATGESCATSSSCCSHLCAADGRGVSCQNLGGCRQAGELCMRAEDCCSRACEIFDAVSGVGRCAVSPTCAATGEVCEIAGDPSVTRDCCATGGSPAAALCAPSDVAGVRRCVTEARSLGSCLPDGMDCASPSDCCGRFCLQSAGGTFTCSSVCVETGGVCTRDVDCCTADCTASGLCSALPAACGAVAQACGDDADCCSGACGADGVCASPLF